MSNRTAKFLSALFASVLAGVPLGTMPQGPANAAEECLSAPKGASPEGSHWYYRIDRATKRHCWYLGQRDKPSQTASRSTRSEKSAAAKTESSARHSIADARAELPASAGVQQTNQDDAPVRAASAAPVTVAQNTQPAANTQATAPPWPDPQASVVASRWPDLPAASPAISPPPGEAQLAATQPSNAAAAPSAAVAAAPVTAADSPRQTQSGSLPMLLAVITGALALAGIIASVVFKFGGIRRFLQPSVRKERRAIWDNTEDESLLRFAHTEEDAALSPRAGFDSGLDETDEWSDRLPEFLAKVPRRAPT
jgi:hypothetical protein